MMTPNAHAAADTQQRRCACCCVPLSVRVGPLWFIDHRSGGCALSEERSASARCGAKGRDLRVGGWLGRGTQVKPCIVNTKGRWCRNVEGHRQRAEQWYVNGPRVGSLESGLSIA